MHTSSSAPLTTDSDRNARPLPPRPRAPRPARRPAFFGSLAGLVAGAGLCVAGCADRAATGPAAPASGAASPTTTTDYPLRGTVRSANAETGEVMIHHEAVPGFMGAMTMPFSPENREIVATLHPGDAVEGNLRVVRTEGAVTDYRLLDLRAVPSPATSKTADATEKKSGATRFRVIEPPPRLKPGELVPDFQMTLQNGESARPSDWRGKVVVLTFIYTRCPIPDFCPRMDRSFSRLAQSLSAFPKRAEHVRLVSLSFDPEHDTPDILSKHARILGAEPPLWTYAVATHEELAKIAPRLGMFFGPDGREIAHNLCTAVIGPDGRLARLEVGTQPNHWETADMLRTIYALLPGAAG